MKALGVFSVFTIKFFLLSVSLAGPEREGRPEWEYSEIVPMPEAAAATEIHAYQVGETVIFGGTSFFDFIETREGASREGFQILMQDSGREIPGGRITTRIRCFKDVMDGDPATNVLAGRERWVVSIATLSPESGEGAYGERGVFFTSIIDIENPGARGELLSHVLAIQRSCNDVQGKECYTHKSLAYSYSARLSRTFIQVTRTNSEQSWSFFLFEGNPGRPKPKLVEKVESDTEILMKLVMKSKSPTPSK